MTDFDVFNGDADGICALHQMRLAEPRDAVLVTGVKRDNALLHRVIASPGDSINVLDIALERNRSALLALLREGVHVRYLDHHDFDTPIPQHPLLDIEINTSPEICTSVIVDRRLEGRYRSWAVAAAFGDNLPATACRLGATFSADGVTLAALRELGECLNYNAYGASEGELICPPAELYCRLRSYEDPLRFMASEPVFERIRDTRAEDVRHAMACVSELCTSGATFRRLPDEAWARRVVGSFANHLANIEPERAHCVVVPDARGGFSLSLRVSATAATSAGAFCSGFGGGGRQIAAGCDGLRSEELPQLFDELVRTYS